MIKFVEANWKFAIFANKKSLPRDINFHFDLLREEREQRKSLLDTASRMRNLGLSAAVRSNKILVDGKMLSPEEARRFLDEGIIAGQHQIADKMPPLPRTEAPSSPLPPPIASAPAIPPQPAAPLPQISNLIQMTAKPKTPVQKKKKELRETLGISPRSKRTLSKRDPSQAITRENLDLVRTTFRNYFQTNLNGERSAEGD